MTSSHSIKGIIVLATALVLAVWLGLSVVTNQEQTIINVIGVAILIFCFSLGPRIWLLIPFTSALAIGLRIPGQPDALLLGQLLLIAFTIPQFLLRKLPFQLKWTEIEIWMLVLTLLIVQVYLRNPVGVNIFGADTVGGKGYALYGIAAFSSLILCGLRVPPPDLKWMLRLTIAGGVMNFIISVIGTIVPAVGFYTGMTYTRADEPNHDSLAQPIDTGMATRIAFLGNLGKNLALWISSFISPLMAIVRPLWLLLMMTSLIAALMSGFRNNFMAVALTLVIGVCYRNGIKGFISILILSTAGLALIALINLAVPLPPNIQRSLTFLPGTWEERYIDDAEGSTEWRIEIWKEALLTDRWIQNKWLGDGLGFSAAELQAQANQRKEARTGVSGLGAHVENVLISGDYHSGPVSTVRVVGYLGLILFVIAQIRLAINTHHLIKRCKGTQWYPITLLSGIPTIYAPFFFIFIFGDFKTNAAVFLLSCGIFRILKNNIPSLSRTALINRI